MHRTANACARRGSASSSCRRPERAAPSWEWRYSVGCDDADDLTRLDRLARGNGELCDTTGAVRAHLFLHLHRLDDAENLTGIDVVALGDLHCEHRALHRADDRILASPARAATTRSLATTPGQLGEGGLGPQEPHLEPAPIDLDRAHALAHRRRSGRLR